MKVSDGFDFGGNIFMYMLTAVQTKEVFQIISLILSILISVVILITKFIDWYKRAKEDGKISKEEIKELEITTKEDVSQIKDNVEDLVDAIQEQEKEK